jgi:hypothetical protein
MSVDPCAAKGARFAIADLRFAIEKRNRDSSIANCKSQIANPSTLPGVAYGLSVPVHRLRPQETLVFTAA